MKFYFTLFSALFCWFGLCVSVSQAEEKPNIIIIMTDDQGYNDLGCYGSEKIKTPRIDQMASEGLRLTSFYQAAPLCGPSRASLLTGCYSQRLAERTENKDLHTQIHPDEVFLSEVLLSAGYATGCIGKWHVAGSGRHCVTTDKKGSGLAKYSSTNPSIMPSQKGFEYYYGIPYSNDMRPAVIMRNNEFIDHIGNGNKQTGITTRYTDEALKFITKNKAKPFFLYLAHNMPHTPLWPGKKFEGKSEYGRYGDCIEEIDWNVGRIFDTLKELDIDDNTLVIFTSDNGPWIRNEYEMSQYKKIVPSKAHFQAGNAEPLRGTKLTTHDGGLRVPFIVRYPKQIEAGRSSDELASGLDLFPTLAKLAGAKLPTDRTIDGIDLSSFFTGKSPKSPRSHFYFYKWLYLHAVRDAEWKLVLPRKAKYDDLRWYARYQEEVAQPTLYNLKSDIGETTNVADKHPEVVANLMQIVTAARNDLGDHKLGIPANGSRHKNSK